MAKTDPSERSDRACNPASTKDEDEFMQFEVLLFVLESHPDSLTVPELVTEFGKASPATPKPMPWNGRPET